MDLKFVATACAILEIAAACDFLAPKRYLLAPIDRIVAPDSLGSTDTLRLEFYSSSGICDKVFDHLEVIRDSGFRSFAVWIREEPLPEGANCGDVGIVLHFSEVVLPSERRDPMWLAFRQPFGPDSVRVVRWH